MQLYVDRSLVDRVVPGNRVTVLGIYSIKKSFAAKKAGASGKSDNVGVRAPYMRVIGIEVSSNQNSNSNYFITGFLCTSEILTLFSRKERVYFL